MRFITDMKFVHTYTAIFGTTDLLLFMVMKRTPWCQCNGKYPKQKNGENPVDM